MNKEQLCNEILAASPLLDTFLNHEGSDRELKIRQIANKNWEKMANIEGRERLFATLITATQLSIPLHLFPHSDTLGSINENEEKVLRDFWTVGLFMSIGFEIGAYYGERDGILLFLEDITNKALAKGMIEKEYTTHKNLNELLTDIVLDTYEEKQEPFGKVAALIQLGYLVGKDNNPSLGVFEEFLKNPK